MKERIEMMRNFFVRDKKQKESRIDNDFSFLTEEFAKEDKCDIDRATERLVYFLDHETPVVYPFEKIAFTRTLKNIPELFTADEEKKLREKFHLHEKGDVCNINVNYSALLSLGFPGVVAKIENLIAKTDDASKIGYWNCQIKILQAIDSLMARYSVEAERVENNVVMTTIDTLRSRKPETLLEAYQMFRIIHFVMWAGRNYHNTVGRFDQYMYPYYKHDIDCGILDNEGALELTEEFFLSFNRDSDLYPGMQQGDNGQSLVLGGCDIDGNDTYNDLSDIAMHASLELRLIDPKINLRVSRNTPFERYVLGTHMTKQGLGFPQYSNDDVVIDGLCRLGYDRKDAVNYVVAACWEFIIPGVAMDIPNLDALSFAKIVRETTMNKLAEVSSFDEFMAYIDDGIKEEADKLIDSLKPIYIFPAPFISLMMDGCIENARDISLGAKYNNYGFHGTGLATAVDSLAEIKKHVFDTQTISANDLVEALNNDFTSNPILGNKLRYDDEKFGNDTELTNSIADHLLNEFAKSLEGRTNDRGGIFRAGTGSAMYYVWHAVDLGATPDGRHKGEPIPANYSPSLFSKVKGPVSVVKSFSSPDLKNVINGGPLTIEFHDSVFRNDEAIAKVAKIIKSYIDMGGHQLQINTVNKDTLLDAQKHPENYRNLIVRVWGWSGYFVELDKCYQDHIINRIQFLA